MPHGILLHPLQKTKGGFTTSLNQFNLNLNYEKI